MQRQGSLRNNPKESIPRRKAKPKPYLIYTWLKPGTKEVDIQLPCEVGKTRAYNHGTKEFLDVSTADWVSLAGYAHGFETEAIKVFDSCLERFGKKCGKRCGKRCNHIYKRRIVGRGKYKLIYRLVLDFDGASYLLERDIIERCLCLGLPLPMYILQTGIGHYQAVWVLRKPLLKEKEGLWRAVAQGMHKAFSTCEEDKELFGCDPHVLNPSFNVRNHRNPKFQTGHKGKPIFLSQIYSTLKEHGYIQPKPQTKWQSKFNPNYKPKKVTKARLIKYLIANPELKATYRELEALLNIPERSLEKWCSELRLEGKLTTRVEGKGRNRRTVFTTHFFKPHIKDSLTVFYGVSADASQVPGLKKPFLEAFDMVNAVGLPLRCRNKGFFMLSLGLKVCGFTQPEVFTLLWRSFSLSRYVGSHAFKERAFRSVVRNAFKPKFVRCVAFDNPAWDWHGFLNRIRELERQKLREIAPNSVGEAWQSQGMLGEKCA